MHGLAGTHHAAASATVAKHGAAPHDEQAAAHQHAHAADHVFEPTAGPHGPSCDAECPELGLLCVAVLVGAALALLLARRGRVRLLPAPVRNGAPDRAPPMRYARGPDPVKELCVSRT